MQIDITSELRGKIQPIVAQTLPVQIQVPIFGGGWPPLLSMKTTTINLNLYSITFDNLKIENSKLVLENEPHPVGIPNTNSFEINEYDNPTISIQNYSIEHTYKITKGWKIDFSQTISSASKVGGNLKFEFSGIGGGASFEKTITDSITNSNSTSEITEITGKVSIPIVVPAKTKIKVTIGMRNFEARQNFEGAITINGDLILFYGNAEKSEVKKISDILTEDERTFKVSGFYANIDWKEMPIDIDVIQNY